MDPSIGSHIACWMLLSHGGTCIMLLSHRGPKCECSGNTQSIPPSNINIFKPEYVCRVPTVMIMASQLS